VRIIMNATEFFRTHVSTTLMIVLVGATALAGCDRRASSDEGVVTSGVTSTNLADKIEQARTPADHEALAKYYEERARVAQSETAQEQEVRTRYERRWNPDDHPMGRGARDHYNHMIEGRDGEASSYRAMAEWHRQMAGHGEQEHAADQ
jgi:hypothetical protein